MYPEGLSEWLSMDNGFLWGSMLVIGHLINTILALAIFSSIFRKNIKAGYIFLAILISIGLITIKNVFIYSVIVGFIVCFMYLLLGIVTYHSLKKKLIDRSPN